MSQELTAFHYPVMSAEQDECVLSGEFIVGATGAVPTTLTGFRGMGTPVRNGVGDYSFPLSATWGRTTEVVCEAYGAHSTTDGMKSTVIANSVASTTAPLIRVQFYQLGTGAAAEIAQNYVLHVRIAVKKG